MNENICLCYSKGKGFYTRNCFECDDSVFRVYDSKGYRTTNIEVPETEINIKIASNFGYGANSYLFATIHKSGTQILDFSIDKIGMLNHNSINEISVQPEDWNSLLESIALTCNGQNTNSRLTGAIRYIDELNKVLNAESIEIVNKQSGSPTIWEGEFLVTLLVGDRLRDLMEGLRIANIEDEVINEHILTLCSRFVRNLKHLDINPEDSRVIRLAETLTCICEYMKGHNAELDFMLLFLNDYKQGS